MRRIGANIIEILSHFRVNWLWIEPNQQSREEDGNEYWERSEINNNKDGDCEGEMDNRIVGIQQSDSLRIEKWQQNKTYEHGAEQQQHHFNNEKNSNQGKHRGKSNYRLRIFLGLNIQIRK